MAKFKLFGRISKQLLLIEEPLNFLANIQNQEIRININSRKNSNVANLVESELIVENLGIKPIYEIFISVSIIKEALLREKDWKFGDRSLNWRIQLINPKTKISIPFLVDIKRQSQVLNGIFKIHSLNSRYQDLGNLHPFELRFGKTL